MSSWGILHGERGRLECVQDGTVRSIAPQTVPSGEAARSTEESITMRSPSHLTYLMNEGCGCNLENINHRAQVQRW